MRLFTCSLMLALTAGILAAQDAPQNPGLRTRPDGQTTPGTYTVAPGTRILLSMINSISTKQAQIGDRIYLETAFPVFSNGKIVIPQGSWVTGTVTEVKRPGRMSGKGELQVRFDSLTLPNGVNRDFRADLAGIDARDDQTLKREESKVEGPGDKKSDVGTVVASTTAGGVIGSGIGAAAGNVARGAGIGVGVGAAAGLLGVLMTRGPEAILAKGSSVEMVLDRPLTYQQTDLDFSNAPPRSAIS
jgi:type IV secretion system protein VirB10